MVKITSLLMRADYYCKLKGTCELYSNMVLKICNDEKEIKHSKGKLKSVQSRYIRTPLREKISEQLQETNTPGKEWLRNLKISPQNNSMQVIWGILDKASKFLGNCSMREN